MRGCASMIVKACVGSASDPALPFSRSAVSIVQVPSAMSILLSNPYPPPVISGIPHSL